jgi:hypothetical protein
LVAFFFGIVAFFRGADFHFASGEWEAEEAETATVTEMEMEMLHLDDLEIELDVLMLTLVQGPTLAGINVLNQRSVLY